MDNTHIKHIVDNKNLFNYSINNVINSLNEDDCWFAHSDKKLLIYDKKTRNTKICWSAGKNQPILSIKTTLNENKINVPPSNLYDAQLVYNPDNDKFYLFGGRIYNPENQSEKSAINNSIWTKHTSVWCLIETNTNINTNNNNNDDDNDDDNSDDEEQWLEYKQLYTPKQSCDFSICYSQYLKAFIMFGGYDFDSNNKHLENSIWFYFIADNCWSFEKQFLQLSFSKIMPTKRRNSFLTCYEDNLILFSGIGEYCDDIYYDTWLLNLNCENLSGLEWIKLCDQVYQTHDGGDKENNFNYDQITLSYNQGAFVIEIKNKICYMLDIAKKMWEDVQKQELHTELIIDSSQIDQEQSYYCNDDTTTYVVYTYFNSNSCNLSIITIEEESKNIVYQNNYDFFYNFDPNSTYTSALVLKYLTELNINVMYNSQNQLEIWREDKKKVFELEKASFVINLNKLIF